MQLYEHQMDAVKKLKCGNILRGGVGSGKSLTALAYYYTIINGGTIPNGDTKDKKDGTKDIKLYIITTAAKRNKKEWERDCIPLGVQPVVVDSWHNIKKYESVQNAFFIFDEQKVIGSGMWVKCFLKIVKRNRWILLSATPGDTWSDYIPVFVANGFYRNRTEFLRVHAVYSRFSKYPQIERYIDEGILIRYRNAITVDMPDPRTTKRIEHDIRCGYPTIDYNKASNDRWNIYEDAPVKTAAELCYLLRKICNSDASRTKAIRDIHRTRPRLIIFYSYDYEREILLKYCKTAKCDYGEYNGHNHDAVPSGDKWIYIVQYTAGAEGWNCITTDSIAFYSLPYSYKALEQSMGRIDRINTPYDQLHYYFLESRSKIDASVRKALKSKKDFNEGKFVGF